MSLLTQFCSAKGQSRPARILTSAFVVWLSVRGVSAAEPDSIAFFESKIRPLLIERCHECHSTASGKSKGGLRLDSLPAILQGGDSGPALVVGNPERSLLIQALSHGEEVSGMPPKGKLPDGEIAALTAWVKSGAVWHAIRAVGTPQGSTPKPNASAHWAWQPVQRREIPPVGDGAWGHLPVDAFILEGLEAKGWSPAPAASWQTLIRRLSFDLTGLPPTPEEVEAFLGDCGETEGQSSTGKERQSDAETTDVRPVSPSHGPIASLSSSRAQKAYERLVGRLLTSPRFGEHWGRHWLDVARYSDSIGGGMNHVLDDAWRYRDYVVSSFNADKPYDRFVREQIAGDLLSAKDEAQHTEQLIATGFLMLGPNELGEYDREKLRMDIVDEQLDTLGKAFLGLTLGCARCHDHKFDPVPTQDYYAMAGILRSTNPLDEKKSTGLFGALRRVPLPQDRATAAAIARASEELASLKEELAGAQTVAKSEAEAGKKAAEERVKALREQVKQQQAKVDKLTPMALAAGEEAQPADSPVLIRGDLHNRGATVPRGYLTLARLEHATPVPPRQSGRLELARWVTDPDHPLTARVMVNRVWHWLMGAGLVRSVDNFGIRGEAPSYPALLDYLAGRFIEQGWSVKALVREIVLSRTYQQSGWATAVIVQADPDNRLYGRHERRRLAAEEIHDALLAVSGTLDETIGGPTNTRTGRLGTEGKDERVAYDPTHRRGLYQPIYRGGLAPDLFRVFDFPDAGLVTGSRNSSTVATQALFLMNSPVMLEHARSTADRLRVERPDDAGRVRLLYQRLFARAPTGQETERALAFLAGPANDRQTAWAALCQSLMISTSFLFVE